jgi:hypothetical protein
VFAEFGIHLALNLSLHSERSRERGREGEVSSGVTRDLSCSRWREDINEISGLIPMATCANDNYEGVELEIEMPKSSFAKRSIGLGGAISSLPE